MFDAKIDATPGFEQLKRWITSLEGKVLEDLTDFWDKGASPAVIEEIARIFATEGYGGWPPLSAQYAAAKQRHYPGRTILRREDNYFRAATRKGEPGNVFVSEPDEMVWGIDLNYFRSAFGFPYPVVHEHRERGKSTSPRRPVFEMAAESKALQNRLVGALQDYLKKTIMRETKKHFG